MLVGYFYILVDLFADKMRYWVYENHNFCMMICLNFLNLLWVFCNSGWDIHPSERPESLCSSPNPIFRHNFYLCCITSPPNRHTLWSPWHMKDDINQFSSFCDWCTSSYTWHTQIMRNKNIYFVQLTGHHSYNSLWNAIILPLNVIWCIFMTSTGTVQQEMHSKENLCCQRHGAIAAY